MTSLRGTIQVMKMNASRLLLLVAVIIFALVGFGVEVGDLTELEETAFGLAFFAGSGLVD